MPSFGPRGVLLVPTLVSTLVSALLYGLAFPPFGSHLLAWVALGPLLLAIRAAGLRAALGLAWLWLLVMAWTVGDALPRAVAVYFEQPTLFGIGFAIALFSLHGAPYYMAFAAWYRALRHWESPFFPLATGAAWVGAELGRVKFLTGNPWALAGYSQMHATSLIQIADVTGVYGVSFVLVAVNAALVELWLSRTRGPHARRVAIGGAVLVGAMALLAFAYGRFRLAGSEAASSGAPAVPIAIVQGNLDVGSQWRPDLYGRNLDTYLRLTDRVLRDGHPALVLWPESAMTFFLDDEPLYRRAIGRVLSAGGVELLAGGPRAAGQPPQYFNSAFLLNPAGDVAGRYDKQYLLPFAEYFPFARLDFLNRRFGRARVFTPGTPTPPLPTAAGSAGILICNEALFPEIAAARVRQGAAYLVNLANDSWLGDRKYAVRVFDIILLRAVEQRRYLVRVSTSGPSAIVDPWGRIRAATALETQTTTAGAIAPSHDHTLYYRVGDLFAYACTAAALVALLARARRLRR